MLDILAECVRKELRSKQIIAKNGVLDYAMSNFSSNSHNFTKDEIIGDHSYPYSLCVLISAFFDFGEKDEIFEESSWMKRVCMILEKNNLISAVCRFLDNLISSSDRVCDDNGKSICISRRRKRRQWGGISMCATLFSNLVRAADGYCRDVPQTKERAQDKSFILRPFASVRQLSSPKSFDSDTSDPIVSLSRALVVASHLQRRDHYQSSITSGVNNNNSDQAVLTEEEVHGKIVRRDIIDAFMSLSTLDELKLSFTIPIEPYRLPTSTVRMELSPSPSPPPSSKTTTTNTCSKNGASSSSSLTATRLLLAISASHKSELDHTREAALVAIRNATLPPLSSQPRQRRRAGPRQREKNDFEESIISSSTNINEAVNVNNDVIIEVCRCGGMKLLVDLCSSSMPSPAQYRHKKEEISKALHSISRWSIKYRATALLRRCISIPVGLNMLKNNKDAMETLLLEYQTVVLDKAWDSSSEASLSSSLPSSDSESHRACGNNTAVSRAGFAADLVQIIATITANVEAKQHNYFGFEGKEDGSKSRILSYGASLVCVLPRCKTDSKGCITASNVCQLPERPTAGSAYDIAWSSSSFQCNVLRMMIAYMDSDTANDCISPNQNQQQHTARQKLFELGAVERLVCLMANHSSLHPSVTKNASIALAKLISASSKCGYLPDQAMSRCRELRGMEILTHLTKNDRGKM